VLKVEGICSTKMIPGSMELHMRENCFLVLPVNILTVWHASLLGLSCVLIYIYEVLYLKYGNKIVSKEVKKDLQLANNTYSV